MPRYIHYWSQRSMPISITATGRLGAYTGAHRCIATSEASWTLHGAVQSGSDPPFLPTGPRPFVIWPPWPRTRPPVSVGLWGCFGPHEAFVCVSMRLISYTIVNQWHPVLPWLAPIVPTMLEMTAWRPLPPQNKPWSRASRTLLTELPISL